MGQGGAVIAPTVVLQSLGTIGLSFEWGNMVAQRICRLWQQWVCRTLNKCACSVVCALALAGASTAAGSAEATQPHVATPEKLTFGVFAYLGVAQTRKFYEPLVAYLNATLKEEQIELKVLPQEEINRGVEKGELDIVTTNPTHFLVIRNQYPLTGVIATRVAEVNGNPVQQLAGVMLTQSNRDDIETLQDIRNKVIATPSLLHMGGYRAQAYELYLAGIKLPRAAKKIIELKTHQDVVRAVLSKQVDVGFVREGVLELMLANAEISAADYKLIHRQQHAYYPFEVSTRLYPEWPVFALPHVSGQAVRHVAAALFALESDNPAAKAAGVYGYTVSADYLSVEALARALRLPPFDQYLDVTWQDIWQSWRQGLTIAAVAAVIIVALVFMLMAMAGRERTALSKITLLLDTLGEGVFGTDTRGHCTFINRAALQMLAMKEPQVIGQPVQGILNQASCAEKPDVTGVHPMVQTMQDGQIRRGEDWFVGQADAAFPVEYVVSPVRSKTQIIGVVVAFQDIRLRKAIEADLHQLVKELTQANVDLKATRDQLLQSEKLASIGQLAAGVAHEINNPVAFVTSNLGTLGNYLQDLLRLVDLASATPEGQLIAAEIDLAFLKQDVVELLGESKDGLERVRKIVLDLRDFSRAGDAAWEHANLNDCIESTLNILGNELKYKCTVHKRFAELPPLRCIPSQLGQVFMNLLMNAAQAIETQGDLFIQTEAVGSQVARITIRDTGSGIAPEHLKRIFDPFFTTKPVGKGTGLGLSLVWGIIERHRGQINIDSTVGQGTTFTIDLPFNAAIATHATPLATPANL